jgi:hypothetical protein
VGACALLLPLLLALALAPLPGSVEIDRETFHALTAASPAEVVVPAWAAHRSLVITPVEGGVLLRASWTLRSLSKDAWFSGHVLGDMPGVRIESVRWNGQPAATSVGPGGVAVAGKVSGRATLELVAFVPGDPARGALRLAVMPAARGEVTASAPAGQVATFAGVPGEMVEPSKSAEAVDQAKRAGGPAPVGPPLQVGARFLTGAAALDLSFGAAPSAPGDAAPVVVARAGLGLTVGDAELRGRGRLVWELRRGALTAVEFTAAGVGADLEVTGAGVRAVQRSGEQVRVELQAPVTTRLELELRWTSPIGAAAESRVALPQIGFTGVFRAEAALQLARDGEVEAVPDARGWTPSSAAALPVWGQGLVEGAPTAAFTAASGAGSGQLDLLRFVPLPGPPVVVDVAAYTIATSREGRALMRAHYEVRNERAASLRIRPPKGFKILGVRVAGETAMIARDRDGAWRVPLQRSVDTVSGLLSFPVEVALLGDEADPWARRERRKLALPRLDAPIAVTRVTLHLPPGYRSKVKPGDGEVVAGFTRGEGITYGLGVGEVGAAEADALFQGAVKRWLGNDFSGAQAELDKLKAMGASNENIARLQGNLDLIAGRSDKQDATVQRRIREQAKARAVVDQVAQEQLQKQAEESRKAGDYQAAESQYRAALEVGDRLAKLEQKESVEQSTRNEALRSELASNAVQAKVSQEIQVSGKARRRFGSFRARGPRKGGGKSAGNVSFESSTTTGDLAQGGQPGSGPANGYADSDGDGAVDELDVSEKEVDLERAPAKAPPAQAPPVDTGVADKPAPVGRDFTAIVAVTPGVSPDAAKAPVAPRPPPSAGERFDPKPAGSTVEKPEEPQFTPTASRDAAGVRLSGTTGAESSYQVDGANISSVNETVSVMPGRTMSARRSRTLGKKLFSRKRGSVRTRDTLDTKFKDETKRLDDDRDDGEGDERKRPEEGLGTPVVTASAVSVVVPGLGAAVLYQRLLLPADATHTIDIFAREPLISRDK